MALHWFHVAVDCREAEELRAGVVGEEGAILTVLGESLVSDSPDLPDSALVLLKFPDC